MANAVTLRCPTCPPGRCNRRGQPPTGGWTCRHLAGLEVLQAPEPESTPVHVAGWSRGAVIPCPACLNRCYSAGPAGLPERRCDGPAGCGHVFNPEADVRPPLASHLRPDPRPLAATLISTDPEE